MRANTVKIPPQWARINSARMQAYLRDYFIHPLTLPADLGASECTPTRGDFGAGGSCGDATLDEVVWSTA